MQRRDAGGKEPREPAHGELGAVGEGYEAHELVDHPERHLRRRSPVRGDAGLRRVPALSRSGSEPIVPPAAAAVPAAAGPERVVAGEGVAPAGEGLGAAGAGAGARAAADGGGCGGGGAAADCCGGGGG